MMINSEIISKVFTKDVSKQELLEWSDSEKNNIWHILIASKITNIDLFNFICDKVTIDELNKKLSEKNDLGDTPLHMAAWSNSVEAIEVLNSKGFNFNEFLDSHKRTILFIAAEMNHQKIIDICLSQNVDFNHVDEKGRNIHEYAQYYDNQECLAKMSSQNNIPFKENNINNHEHDGILDFFHKNKTALRGNKTAFK